MLIFQISGYLTVFTQKQVMMRMKMVTVWMSSRLCMCFFDLKYISYICSIEQVVVRQQATWIAA